MSVTVGVGSLSRLALRRDRVRIPVWIVSIVGLVLLTAVSFEGVFPTEADRAEFGASIAGNAAFRALYGPIYDLTTIGGITTWRLCDGLSVLAGLMSLLLVVRHTRSEEEEGRLELLRSGATSPLAAPLAAVVIVVLANVAVAVGIALGMIGLGNPAAGSWSLALGTAASGMLFGAVALLTSQIASTARSAAGIAGLLLGLSFLLRIVGDAAQNGLTWFTPMGWPQHMRSYAGEQWWVLALPVSCTFVVATVALVVARRRDLGAGTLRERAGKPRAAAWLVGTTGLAVRLQRTSWIAWACGLVTGCALVGALAEDMREVAESTDAFREAFERLGGPGAVVDSFLQAMITFAAVLSAAFAVQSIGRLRGEEEHGNAESVLATAASRRRWAWSHVAVAFFGSAMLLALSGFAMGLAHAIRSDDASQLGRVTWATLVDTPAVLVLAALAFAAYGIRSRFAVIGWYLFGLALFLTELGAALQLTQWVRDLSPFQHVPQCLVHGGPSWVGAVVLLGVALVVVEVGQWCLRRRDIG